MELEWLHLLCRYFNAFIYPSFITYAPFKNKWSPIRSITILVNTVAPLITDRIGLLSVLLILLIFACNSSWVVEL